MTSVQNHRIRTFGTPVCFAAAAFFAGGQRYLQYFPGATKTSLFYLAGLSSLAVVGSGLLFSDEIRRTSVMVGLLLSSLAAHYKFKETIPLKTALHCVAAEATLFVAVEVLTSDRFQKHIISNYLKNGSYNHNIRTFGTPILFAAAAFLASHPRYITYFPGATRNSLLCLAGLSSLLVVGGGIILSHRDSDQTRRISILAGLLFSALGTHYGLKKAVSLQTTLRFAVAEAALLLATEVITSDSLQTRIIETRESFLINPAHSYAMRLFGTSALFVAAAFLATTQYSIEYFPGASRKSFFCLAGLSSGAVLGCGIMLSTQEEDPTRRISILAGILLSSLVTHYAFKETLPLKTALRFAATEAIILGATEALTSGGPTLPRITLHSSLNRALLSITAPHEKLAPPNVTITFCVDTSSSMNEENREKDVKKGVSDVLDNATQVTQTIKDASINIAVVGFSGDATIIHKPTPVMSDTLQGIKDAVNGYRSNGTTDLYAGLIKAVETMETLKKEGATHTLILLTDGEVKLTSQQIQQIHQRLAAMDGRLFVIGIGAKHHKETLQKLAPETETFKGRYIDTTQPGQTIVGAISSIYEQVLSSFNQMELRSSQLGAGEWSLGGQKSLKRGDYSVCLLENVSEKTPLEQMIKIHSKTLPSKLDLSQVSFELVFKDPTGKSGVISIPWKANTIIDPSIARFVFQTV